MAGKQVSAESETTAFRSLFLEPLMGNESDDRGESAQRVGDDDMMITPLMAVMEERPLLLALLPLLHFHLSFLTSYAAREASTSECPSDV